MMVNFVFFYLVVQTLTDGFNVVNRIDSLNMKLDGKLSISQKIN